MDRLPISEDLQKSLSSPSAPIRRDAVATLVQIFTTSDPPDPRIEAFLDSLAHYDPDDRVRQIAGTALGWNTRLLDSITVLWNPSTVPQRLEAVVALRYFLTEGTEVETLLAHEWLARLAHHDEDEQVREAADQALPKPQQRESTRFAEPRGPGEPGTKISETGQRGEPVAPRRRRWLPVAIFLLLFVGGLAGGAGANVALSNYIRSSRPSTPTQEPLACGNNINMISVRAGSIMFSKGWASSTSGRVVLDLTGDPRRQMGKDGDVLSLDIAPDDVHVVESRQEGTYPRKFISTWKMGGPGDDDDRLLTDGILPAWSPDMKHIAYYKYYRWDSYGLSVMDADGSNSRLLRYTRVANAPPSWSPDGAALLISDHKSTDLYAKLIAVNVDDASESVVLDSGLSADFPAWSPDGSTIAYVSTDVYTMNADGSNRRKLTEGQFKTIATVGWSSDATYLVFLATDQEDHQGIYLMGSDGSDLHRIWSPCDS